MARSEENTDAESTPRKDLVSAVAIGALAIVVMRLSIGFERPDRWATAPGLLPLITGLALLLMAGALGWRALRLGAARGALAAMAATARDAWRSNEERRAALLAALVIAYVVVVARQSFELRLATPTFELLLTGFELVSIVVVATILKVFWRATLLRCTIVAVASVEVLALSFRYGFNLIMPQAF